MNKQLEELLRNGLSVAKTNKFRVTDEEKYAALLDRICGEKDEIVYDTTSEDEYGFVLHSFSAFDEIIYDGEGGYNTFEEEFIPALQEILPETEVFLLVSHHIIGMQQLHSHCYIVTKDDFQVLVMDKLVRDFVSDMLEDTSFVHYLDE